MWNMRFIWGSISVVFEDLCAFFNLWYLNKFIRQWKHLMTANVYYSTWGIVGSILIIVKIPIIQIPQFLLYEMTYFVRHVYYAEFNWFLVIIKFLWLCWIYILPFFYFIKYIIWNIFRDIVSDAWFHLLLKTRSWDFSTGFQVPILRWWVLHSVVKWCETTRFSYQIVEVFHEQKWSSLETLPCKL